MKLSNKLLLIMVFLSFGIMFKTVVNADWWDRGERPVLPRDEFILPTNPPEPTVQPTNPPNQPTVTPPKTGEPQVTPTLVPTGSSSTSSNDDPCASGKSYTGDYCGWSPRIGGNDGSTGDSSSSYDYGSPPVLGLSYTAGEEIGLSDIMLLSGILCLSLYVKSKFAPGKIASLPAKKRSR